MMRSSTKKVTWIFVARIPPSVTESTFRRHFEKYREITDLYMPKDRTTKGHRGIGFITFASAESVDNLMNDTHELGGSNVAVDRATTPKLGDPARGVGRKIFVGRLPQEATAEDLRRYFGRFGRILDVYIRKDPKRSEHRGFGFVTFAEDGVADRVARRSHEILGQPVAIDSAAPVNEAGGSGGLMIDSPEPYGSYGPMRTYGGMYGSLDFDDWGYGVRNPRPSRADSRYRPY